MRRYAVRKIRIPWYMTKPCIVIEILLLLLLGRGLLGIIEKKNAAHTERSIIEEEHVTVEQSYRDLEQQVEYLETPYGQERVLRQTHGVVLPGEQEVNIITPKSHERELLPLEEDNRSWWRKIWEG